MEIAAEVWSWVGETLENLASALLRRASRLHEIADELRARTCALAWSTD